ncbi:creatininase family protein [soil metagenome]
MTHPMLLGELTTDETRDFLARPRTAALVPVGSVEPHGPHLPLATDTVLSEVASRRAIALLTDRGIDALVAPSVPYGVTDYARGFAGALSVPKEALTAYLRAVAESLLDAGFARVAFVNNHLEPAHDAAVREAAAAFTGRVVVACPLTRRWGRTLSDEFKRGNCHAGRYETSLVLAAGARIREDQRVDLAPLETSLAEGIKSGKTTFAEMGMDRAYTGAPADATKDEGDELYAKLAEMVATEVSESFG